MTLNDFKATERHWFGRA